MRRRGNRSGRRRCGLTLVEVAVSSLIVGALFVAVMNTVGSAQTTTILNARRLRALQLAQDLLAEVLAQPYVDAAAGATLGPEGDENDLGRTGFDDVDDYHKLEESPVVERDGSASPGAGGLRRTVAVSWVKPDSLGDAEQETGLKKVTVTVWHGPRVVVTLSGVRAEVGP